MQTESVLAAVVEELREMPFEEIRNRYPDEWVVVGNPVEGERDLKVLSGIPLVHGYDKNWYVGKAGKPLTNRKLQSYLHRR